MTMSLFAGEVVKYVAGAPTLVAHRPCKSDAAKRRPLIVFVPGAAHLARIAYGGHSGCQLDTFLAHWINESGFNFLGVSYPVETSQNLLCPISAAFSIEKWGQQIAEVTRSIVDQHQLSSDVIVLAWSMAGKVLEPCSRAMANLSLKLGLFVALAATPGIDGLLPSRPPVSCSSKGYCHLDSGAEHFLRQLRAVAPNCKHIPIDDDIYQREYIGNTPIGLMGYGLKYREDTHVFVEDTWSLPRDSSSHKFANMPLLASISPTSSLDLRHALADSITWKFMLTWKLVTDIDARKQRGYSETDWQKAVQLTRDAPEYLTTHISGNHFFFLGREGAKQTAKAVVNLISRAREVQHQVDDLLGKRQ